MGIREALGRIATMTIGVDCATPLATLMREVAREALAQQPAALVELTDDEILNVMRDGYGCRENDWQDHINFARAIIAKQGGVA